MTLFAGFAVLAAVVLILDVSANGPAPLIGWSFLVLLVYRLAIAMQDAARIGTPRIGTPRPPASGIIMCSCPRQGPILSRSMRSWAHFAPLVWWQDADARLSHSPVLLPTLLVSAELSVNVNYGIRVTFVSSSTQTVAPLRQFLQHMGIATTITSLEAAELDASTLHVFVLQNEEDAARYAASFAGRRCERQLLVCEDDFNASSAFASIKLDADFAYNFVEAFAEKLTKLAHSSALAV